MLQGGPGSAPGPRRAAAGGGDLRAPGGRERAPPPAARARGADAQRGRRRAQAAPRGLGAALRLGCAPRGVRIFGGPGLEVVLLPCSGAPSRSAAPLVEEPRAVLRVALRLREDVPLDEDDRRAVQLRSATIPGAQILLACEREARVVERSRRSAVWRGGWGILERRLATDCGGGRHRRRCGAVAARPQGHGASESRRPRRPPRALVAGRGVSLRRRAVRGRR
mmetsp:Transcript_60307/g.169058  ORF Transcript_60307/g.169058 Transcript_60307/m.169058 type:complete len:223 (-) Transcript_60307:97-765(-)